MRVQKKWCRDQSPRETTVDAVAVSSHIILKEKKLRFFFFLVQVYIPVDREYTTIVEEMRTGGFLWFGMGGRIGKEREKEKERERRERERREREKREERREDRPTKLASEPA